MTQVLNRILRQRELALILILLLLFSGFSYSIPGFLDWFGLLERTRYWVTPGLLAVPMTFIIATAGIDLSVGSIVAMCGIVLGLLYRDAGLPIWLACLAAVVAGGAAGAVNGSVSSFLSIPPLVVTLATMTLYRGLAMGISQADSISNFPPGFLWLSQGDIARIPLAGGPVFIPACLCVLLLITAVGAVLMARSWIGRYSEAIGENETAAVFAAVPVKGLKFWLYTASGLMCGISSLFYTALFATAKADVATGLELEVIACVVIGGTRISGGKGSVLGALLGLCILSILRYGLELAGMPSQYVIIVVGVLLIVTVVFNEWMVRRKGAEG